MQVPFLGRAPRTKETLPDFLKWRRVTRPPLVFRGLTGSQRTPGFWGVTLKAVLNALPKIENPPETCTLEHTSINGPQFPTTSRSKIQYFSNRGRLISPAGKRGALWVP